MTQLTVDLGEEQKSVDIRLDSGNYASASDVLRAALRALDREESKLGQSVKAKVEMAMADPRPKIPASEVFARLERKHAGRMKAGGA